MSDADVAAVARNLAEALRDAAYTRKDEDKKRVAQLNYELCAAVKKEALEISHDAKTT